MVYFPLEVRYKAPSTWFFLISCSTHLDFQGTWFLSEAIKSTTFSLPPPFLLTVAIVLEFLSECILTFFIIMNKTCRRELHALETDSTIVLLMALSRGRCEMSLTPLNILFQQQFFPDTTMSCNHPEETFSLSDVWFSNILASWPL